MKKWLLRLAGYFGWGAWMCSCGYEGARWLDGGKCPKCRGAASCPWNG